MNRPVAAGCRGRVNRLLAGASAPLPLLLLQVLLAALPRGAAGQLLTGRVTDEATGTPILAVRVGAIEGNGAEQSWTTTDSTGAFVLRLPAGRYALRLERLGYQPFTSRAVKLARGEVLTLELRLGVRAVAIEPLVITARIRPPPNTDVFERRRAQYQAAGVGRFLTRGQLDSVATTSVHTLLERDPAVRILRGPNNDVVAFAARGLTCLPALFLDGVRIRNDQDTDLTSFIQLDQIDGIEIYPSAAFAPPELRVEGCGSLAIWSRSSRGNPFAWRRLAVAGAFITLAVIATR